MNRKPQSLKQQLKQPAPPLSFAAFQFPAFLMDKGKIKKRSSLKFSSQTAFTMPVVGVEPTRVISTRDFEFLSASSIWCHPVISSDIWFPLCKGKIHDSTNNNLKCPRFFDAFFLYSVFSVWTAKMEIGGMFRRDAGQNAVCLGTKRKESQG